MLEQELQKANHMKVKLTYQSAQPHTEAALTLQKLGLQPPYVEQVRVLVPGPSVFSDLEAFRPVFEHLRTHRVVPSDSLLTGYAFDDQETAILAYVIEPDLVKSGSIVPFHRP